MAEHDAVTDVPDEALEAFLRYALIFYSRGVLMRRNCTSEWEACAKFVLKEMVDDPTRIG